MLHQLLSYLSNSCCKQLKFVCKMFFTMGANVVKLYAIFSSKKNMNLVLEYLDSDLEQIIKYKSIVFMPGDIKSWMLMTLRGLEHCHRCWILHRVCT